MNKKSILILTGTFYPDPGGPARMLNYLIEELIKYDFKVKVLTFATLPAKDFSYPVSTVSRQIPQPWRSFGYLVKALYLGASVDILYVQDLYFPGWCGWLIKNVFRKKMVTRFVGDSAWETALNRGLTTDDILTFQQKTYSGFLEKLKTRRQKILVNSDYVVVVSNFLKELAVKIGVPPEKIKVIYNSVEFLKPTPIANNFKRSLGLNGPVVLSAARLTPWKGIDTLIKLWPELLKQFPEVSLVILGDGPQFDNLKQLVKELRLQTRVHLYGNIAQEKIASYLQVADLFILNSNYEGMSHLLLEAMTAGTPVVASRSGGNPETIIDGQTGLLFDYNNSEQIITVIKKILTDKELSQQLVVKAKVELINFSWSKLVEQTVGIFNLL
ncbi:MAG: glycosyltransferase family 4 protein [Candidatus Buchananbacteria bacterium]